MTLRVAVVTSSRADWSHLRRPVAAFHAHPELDPILVATAAMVDHEYGAAIAEVEGEGFEVPHRIPCLGGDRDVDMAASGGRSRDMYPCTAFLLLTVRRNCQAKDDCGRSLAPYEEQWRLMDTVHRRCVLVAEEEQR